MVQSVSLSPLSTKYIQSKITTTQEMSAHQGFVKDNTAVSNVFYNPNQFSQVLTPSDQQKYILLLNLLKNTAPSVNSEGVSPSKQLEFLLKNGKLLSKTNDDNSTTLDNLYDIATIPRTVGLDSSRVISDTLDILCNPRYVTQNFGDIPESEKQQVLSMQDHDSDVVKNPDLMNVFSSGTCCAASNEVNMADKYPAEFARWVSKLSSKDKNLFINLDLKSITTDPLEASLILRIFGADNEKFSFKRNKLKVTLDDNAYIRAGIQEKHWDPGERNIADVLVQSAIMRLGSQNTYDSLTDNRAPIFNSNTQGLVEIEKTYVESLIKGKEITSFTYQNVDEDQNITGYFCSFDKIAKHITDTIDSGDDVILGYVLTNETAGVTKGESYNPEIHGAPNKIINGHEITIVDYMRDESGKLSFVCVDTDDDSHDFVIYSADWLLPKIHHAGYPANIVADDEKEMLSKIA